MLTLLIKWNNGIEFMETNMEKDQVNMDKVKVI